MADVESDEIDHLIRDLTVQKAASRATPAVAHPAVPSSPHRAPAPASPIVVRTSGSRREERNPFGRLMDIGELMPSLPAARGRGFFRLAAGFSLPAVPDVRRYFRLPGPVAAARVWVACGVLLGLAMAFWPYQKSVPGLVFYLLALGLVAISGLWGARLSWDARLGSAHTLSIMTTFWAVVLATAETLPLI